MPKTFKTVRLENLDYVSDTLKGMGYKVRVFPLRERGLNQSNFRKLELLNEGNLQDQMRRSRKLRESGLERY